MEKEDLIRPSLLSANFLDLKSDIALMCKLNITHCHFDVMDGSFVPGISFGEPVFKALKGEDIIFDVHLMVVNPLKQVRRYLQLGAKEICFHVENFDNQIDELLAIKKEYPDAKIGLAISPDTDVKVLDQYIEYFDYYLIMSVVPGKGGQKYIEGSENKIKYLADIKKERNLSFEIGVDGGINFETGKLCYDSGATFLVCGSFYFKADDKKKLLKQFGKELGK